MVELKGAQSWLAMSAEGRGVDAQGFTLGSDGIRGKSGFKVEIEVCVTSLRMKCSL
jgi:hypothetical protein